MIYILTIVLYSGQVIKQSYPTEYKCETALVDITVSGKYKTIDDIECTRKK